MLQHQRPQRNPSLEMRWKRRRRKHPASPPVLVTPEQLGEALRDVVVPLQPVEGLQADRDAVDQELPPRDNTLQENNNASVEEATPPQPFPEGENEETIIEVPPELR